jgi:hypothetical protein
VLSSRILSRSNVSDLEQTEVLGLFNDDDFIFLQGMTRGRRRFRASRNIVKKLVDLVPYLEKFDMV